MKWDIETSIMKKTAKVCKAEGKTPFLATLDAAFRLVPFPRDMSPRRFFHTTFPWLWQDSKRATITLRR
jgi:hypothetical protein